MPARLGRLVSAFSRWGPWDEIRDRLYPNWADLAAHYGIGEPRAVGVESVEVPSLGWIGPNGLEPDLVLANSCIDHARGDPGRLSASVLADVVFGHLAARALNVPLLLCFGTGEEIHVVPRGGQLAAGWTAVMARIRTLVEDLEAPASGRQVIHTADPDVWATATDVVAADEEAIPDRHLDGLYRLHPEEPFPRSTPYTYFYRYYRHNVARYRVPFLRAVSDTPARAILVTENAQQLKAVHLASALNRNDGVMTAQLVTVPAPSRSGCGLAMRATGADTVPLSTSVATLPGTSFWQSVVAAYGLFQRCESDRPPLKTKRTSPRANFLGG